MFGALARGRAVLVLVLVLVLCCAVLCCATRCTIDAGAASAELGALADLCAFGTLEDAKMDQDQESKIIFRVVVNHEEQYSIWPTHKEIPRGWRDVGKEGLKTECLAYIAEVWTDMRPLSVRNGMGQR